MILDAINSSRGDSGGSDSGGSSGSRGGQGDRARLAEFLRNTQQFISNTVETGTDPNGNYLFYDELRPVMRAAWEEVREHFDRAYGALQEVSDNRLWLHGLTGSQLGFKLGVVNWIGQRYARLDGKSLFRKLIDAIDTLLESILDALGVGGAISEFKDAMRDAVED